MLCLYLILKVMRNSNIIYETPEKKLINNLQNTIFKGFDWYLSDKTEFMKSINISKLPSF
jgi:hypothetical protein